SSPEIFDWETGEGPPGSSASSISVHSNPSARSALTSRIQEAASVARPTLSHQRTSNRRRFLFVTALTAAGALLAFTLSQTGLPDPSLLFSKLKNTATQQDPETLAHSRNASTDSDRNAQTGSPS